MSLLDKIFHKHQYEIIQEVITKSRAEVQGELIGKISSPRNASQHEELFKRKHITILQCKHCGKLKRYVEVI